MPTHRSISSLLNLSRQAKTTLFLAIDSGLVLMALWLSYFLRMDTFAIPERQWVWLGMMAPVVAIPVFVRNGLYRAVIRYMTRDTIWAVLRAVTLYSLIWAVIVQFSGVSGIPHTLILINWAVALIFIGGSRLTAQWLTNIYMNSLHKNGGKTDRKKVLIYGAGEAGIQLAAGLASHHQTEVVGFIDDSSRLYNQYIRGHRVYSSENLQELVRATAVSEILLALPSVSRGRRTEILTALEPLPVQVRTLPDIASIASGKVKVQDIRAINIADLLGRESVPPDENLMRRNIDNQIVMVTGAGGSIGSELCRQIAMLNPKRIVLFEQSEFNLYTIDRELGRGKVDYVSILGSVYDTDYMAEQCRRYRVNTLFHAAAYKHVPLVEANPEMGVQNNIFGTHSVALAAIQANVNKFVLISTDKAVRPSNVMGATKRFSELILQSLDSAPLGKGTRFIIVRFGNVIDSSGSVIPLFRDQINVGGPVTVTDPDVTRYFMTIPEASQLVIQAGAMGKGGEVFVLDMGDSVKIYDLAVKMIKLSGLTLKNDRNPDGDIGIEFTGLRPGEKLHEELLIGDNVAKTQHDRIMMVSEKFVPWAEIEKKLGELNRQVRQGGNGEIRKILSTVVEGYSSDPASFRDAGIPQ